MNVQSIVKHFIWKVIHDLLPTRHNLFKQGILESNLCPICEREAKTTIPAIWSCPVVTDVRAERKKSTSKMVMRRVKVYGAMEESELYFEGGRDRVSSHYNEKNTARKDLTYFLQHF